MALRSLDKQLLLRAAVYKTLLVDSLTRFRDEKTGVEGYCGVYREHFVILFRQTDEDKDWITNLLYFKKKMPYASSKGSKVRIHGRYSDGYISMSVRGIIHAEYTKYTGHPIFVGGFSQGGGLAPICALDMQYNFNPADIECVMISPPRVFNEAGLKSYHCRVPNTTRYIWGNDIVTKVPPTFFGFTHVGKEKHFGPARVWWKFSFKAHTKYDTLIRSVE